MTGEHRSGSRQPAVRQPAGVRATGDRHGERGMVTVELVFGMLIISIMMAVFGWGILLFGVQVGCIDTARDVARQAARGDQDAVRMAESEAPQGSRIKITTAGQQVRVDVRVRSKPFDFVPAITLTASATALREPGEQR